MPLQFQWNMSCSPAKGPGNDILLEIFYGVAKFTTVAVFLTGIPICRQIWKRKDTDEISCAPFLMGVMGGTCLFLYALLKNDRNVLLVVSSCQIVIFSCYSIFYWFMTKEKLWISIKIAVLIAACAILTTLVVTLSCNICLPLGIICMVLNIADFATPLAGLRVVIRRRATSTLPLPLCVAFLFVSTEWFIYGLLQQNLVLIIPNGVGLLLATVQLVLFAALPRKPGQRAPALQFYDKLRQFSSSIFCSCFIQQQSSPESDSLDQLEEAFFVGTSNSEGKGSKTAALIGDTGNWKMIPLACGRVCRPQNMTIGNALATIVQRLLLLLSEIKLIATQQRLFITASEVQELSAANLLCQEEQQKQFAMPC